MSQFVRNCPSLCFRKEESFSEFFLVRARRFPGFFFILFCTLGVMIIGPLMFCFATFFTILVQSPLNQVMLWAKIDSSIVLFKSVETKCLKDDTLFFSILMVFSPQNLKKCLFDVTTIKYQSKSGSFDYTSCWQATADSARWEIRGFLFGF